MKRRFFNFSDCHYLLGLSAGFANADPVKVKDILDREVTVDLPAKRVVLGFYYQDYMAVGGDKALDNVVGFLRSMVFLGTSKLGVIQQSGAKIESIR